MSMYEEMARSHPKLRRGKVWCTTCGRWIYVDPAECFRSRWPMCHGQTMTLDSPEERAAYDSRTVRRP